MAFYTSCFRRWWQMKDALLANLVLCHEDRHRCSFNVVIWEADPDCNKILSFLRYFCWSLRRTVMFGHLFFLGELKREQSAKEGRRSV